jgi:hypothetical protein
VGHGKFLTKSGQDSELKNVIFRNVDLRDLSLKGLRLEGKTFTSRDELLQEAKQ